MRQEQIVVFTGAGVSAESGIRTFRDSDGLWREYTLAELATPEAWRIDPQRVLEFYNERRARVGQAEPNPAHLAIAQLQSGFKVTVITQNVDDLHERAGSHEVIHVHGEITRARSSRDPSLLYDIGYGPIHLGQTCHKGSQLRPHVVWFGENVLNFERSAQLFRQASRILVVGTSLSVYPVARLLYEASRRAEKVIIAPEVEQVPPGYRLFRALATEKVPAIVRDWLADSD